MLTPDERLALMQTRLKAAFALTDLEIQDNSVAHRGHAAAQSGAGYYHIVISAPELKTLSRVAAHRAVYAVLQDLIPHEIHALQITIGV